MIQKINPKYFSPFTPIVNVAKKKTQTCENKLLKPIYDLERNFVKDAFIKIPEIFY